MMPPVGALRAGPTTLFTEVRGRGILRSSAKRRSEKFAMTATLLLYHRLCWTTPGYGVRVPVHHLPLAPFGPEDHSDPKGERGCLLTPAYPGFRSLYPQDMGELGSYVLL